MFGGLLFHHSKLVLIDVDMKSKRILILGKCRILCMSVRSRHDGPLDVVPQEAIYRVWVTAEQMVCFATGLLLIH